MGLRKTRYIRSVRELVRKHPWFFLSATLAAVALRLFFIIRFPAILDDSKIYADIAKNWLQHGVYGITDDGNIVPTYIRLPGYPAFLALIFAIFGADHYRPVLLAQMVADIGACLLIADMARRMISERAAQAAYLLAGLCPVLANYTAAALTETLEVFFTALALDLAVVGLEEMKERRLLPWLGCGAAVGAVILLRPDGGILLAAIGIYLFFLVARSILTRSRAGPPSPSLRTGLAPQSVILAGVILVSAALAPLVPWTVRNLHTFHRFEPLAPRYANEEDEFVPRGFNRWVKTWMADYTSVQEIYWPIPGEAVDGSKLPARAFDSEQQRQQTFDLIAQYNQELHISPELDGQFAGLAEQRIHAAPLRYYVWLPALRIADMWLRPRTELLPADPRWWEFNDDVKWSVVAVGFGLINLLYVGAAAGGLVRRRLVPGFGVLVAFVALRSLFLGSLENPEPRYTLECYPVIVLLATRLFTK